MLDFNISIQSQKTYFKVNKGFIEIFSFFEIKSILFKRIKTIIIDNKPKASKRDLKSPEKAIHKIIKNKKIKKLNINAFINRFKVFKRD